MDSDKDPTPLLDYEGIDRRNEPDSRESRALAFVVGSGVTTWTILMLAFIAGGEFSPDSIETGSGAAMFLATLGGIALFFALGLFMRLDRGWISLRRPAAAFGAGLLNGVITVAGFYFIDVIIEYLHDHALLVRHSYPTAIVEAVCFFVLPLLFPLLAARWLVVRSSVRP